MFIDIWQLGTGGEFEEGENTGKLQVITVSHLSFPASFIILRRVNILQHPSLQPPGTVSNYGGIFSRDPHDSGPLQAFSRSFSLGQDKIQYQL